MRNPVDSRKSSQPNMSAANDNCGAHAVIAATALRDLASLLADAYVATFLDAANDNRAAHVGGSI